MCLLLSAWEPFNTWRSTLTLCLIWKSLICRKLDGLVLNHSLAGSCEHVLMKKISTLFPFLNFFRPIRWATDVQWHIGLSLYLSKGEWGKDLGAMNRSALTSDSLTLAFFHYQSALCRLKVLFLSYDIMWPVCERLLLSWGVEVGPFVIQMGSISAKWLHINRKNWNYI